MTGYIRLMADYASDGVWSESGAMADRDTLPIGSDLKAEIARWCADYEESQFYLDPGERSVDFDAEAFNSRGEAIAERLRDELPGWRVEHQPQR